MSGQVLTSLTGGVALVLVAGLIACACAAALARSLVSTCFALCAACAMAAAALAVLGSGVGAAAMALVGVAWAAPLLMSGLLLSGRAAREQKKRAWLSVAAACASAALLSAVMFAERLPPPAPLPIALATDAAAWLAGLALVTATGAMALLGHGERGALGGEQQ